MRLLALVVLCALSAACTAAAGKSAEDELAAYLDEQARTGFSGAVLVRRDGRTLVDRALGLADRERGTEVTTETVFDVGSITKVFTAAAVIRLAEEGRLRLDDRLPRFFATVPRDKRRITVRQLLAHRSGLPEYPGYYDLTPLSRAAAVRNALSLRLRFRPGTRQAYSNVGYNLLAAIVERASGERFEAAVRRRVFAPAGMERTGFYGESLWRPEEVAVGYGNRRTTGRNAADAHGPVSWSLQGAGGVASTNGDLARWVDAVRGGKVLRAASVRLLYALAVGPGAAVGYGGANDRGFQSVIVELTRARILIIVQTNSNVLPRFRADDVAREVERLLTGR